MLGAFLITISPFIIMAVSIYHRDLWGSGTFALWRGIPDGAWFNQLIREFVSPVKKLMQGIPTVIHLVFWMLAILGMIRKRKVIVIIPLAFLAYLLTYYHFSAQYAVRIQYIMSIFVVGAAIAALFQYKIKASVLLVPVLVLSLFSVYIHWEHCLTYYKSEVASYKQYAETGKELWASMNRYLKKGEYIFCAKETYRDYVMPHYPVHSLGAYRTMEYFQLNPEKARELEDRYNAVMNSNDYDYIMKVADIYGIKAAVVGGNDMGEPLFQVLKQEWSPVYKDRYFIIYRKL